MIAKKHSWQPCLIDSGYCHETPTLQWISATCFPLCNWSGDPKKSQGINTEGVPQIRKKSTASSNKRWYRVIQNMLIIALDGFFHPYNHRGVDRYPPSTGARNGSTSAPRGTQRTQRCRGRSFQSLWRFQQHPWGKTMAWRFQQHFE